MLDIDQIELKKIAIKYNKDTVTAFRESGTR
jgi:hypothetical protein